MAWLSSTQPSTERSPAATPGPWSARWRDFPPTTASARPRRRSKFDPPRVSTNHPGVSLRPYDARDEEASVALWLRTWQAAYPELDFAERLDWWRKRWRNELVPVAEVAVAEAGGTMIGFVTVDPRTFYLD